MFRDCLVFNCGTALTNPALFLQGVVLARRKPMLMFCLPLILLEAIFLHPKREGAVRENEERLAAEKAEP
jgi:hypothetical protein